MNIPPNNKDYNIGRNLVNVVVLTLLCYVYFNRQTNLEGHSQLLDWTLVFSLWKEFTSTWNRTASRNPLQSSQCLAWFSIIYWKTCFWVWFCSSYDIILSYLVKSSTDRVSMICKFAIKWYLMRMCASWLCPFNFCHAFIIDNQSHINRNPDMTRPVNNSLIRTTYVFIIQSK